ncbi:chemotaxis protein CheV [Vibrio scophthalmi]|uniref:Chemotaxis protein CheV n=1 Tax=Vibrio scophthalmi TaxID=45658 RepID=A0A1E3WF61_9VIBR|nr:chemotaxis protein [Vibrio scophthalmi]ODS04458.1 Chemotaxis protein CheV [Vibrio scophthalmi]
MSNHNILLESGTNELEIAEFQLITQFSDGTTKANHYGINVAKVREVIQFPKITDYPKGGEYVLGVFNSRGKVAPLIHLSKWLGMESVIHPDKKFVIVTDFNGVTNGFLIDAINRIHRVSWSDLHSPENISISDDNDCIIATVNLDDKLVFVLDFEQIIADINNRVDMSSYDLGLDSNIDMSVNKIKQRSQHSVLIVDDSKFIRDQLVTVASQAGYDVITASDGYVAWEIYQQNSATITAVVSDVEMPIPNQLEDAGLRT